MLNHDETQSRDLELINQAADELNAEAEDVLGYQAELETILESP